MKIISKSHGLWELVEKGFENLESKKEEGSYSKKKDKKDVVLAEKLSLNERLMKDAKELCLIQRVIRFDSRQI